MGWWIALGCVVLLLGFMPWGAILQYNAEGLSLKLRIGCFSVPVLRRDEKNARKEKIKSTEKHKKQKKTETKQKKEQKKGGSAKDFLPLLRVLLEALDCLRRRLRVRRMDLKLILAGDDPCDLAINYGRAWTALGALVPQLERFFVIKKRNLEVECDFEASETVILANLYLTISLGSLLQLVLKYSYRAIRKYLKLQKIKKGGATK